MAIWAPPPGPPNAPLTEGGHCQITIRGPPPPECRFDSGAPLSNGHSGPPARTSECAFDRGVPLSNGHSWSASARFPRLPRNAPWRIRAILIILKCICVSLGSSGFPWGPENSPHAPPGSCACLWTLRQSRFLQVSLRSFRLLPARTESSGRTPLDFISFCFYANPPASCASVLTRLESPPGSLRIH